MNPSHAETADDVPADGGDTLEPETADTVAPPAVVQNIAWSVSSPPLPWENASWSGWYYLRTEGTKYVYNPWEHESHEFHAVAYDHSTKEWVDYNLENVPGYINRLSDGVTIEFGNTSAYARFPDPYYVDTSASA